MKNLEIERLRAFAILSIAIYHLGVSFPWVLSQKTGTQYSVDLFFVISGFVVSKTLLEQSGRAAQRAVSRRRQILAFFVRRALRILPLATFCLVYFGIRYLNPPTTNPGFFSLVPEMVQSVLTLRFNYDLVSDGRYYPMGFFWTLMVEEHFYLLLPFALIFLKSYTKRVVACLGLFFLTRWVFQPMTIVFSIPENIQSALIFCTHARLDQLLLGVLLYLFSKHGFHKELQDRLVAKPRWILQAWAWLALGTLQVFPFFIETRWIQTPLPFMLLACGSLLFLSSFKKEGNWVLPLPQRANGLFEYLGSRSYGLYLWHCPVIFELGFLEPLYPEILRSGWILIPSFLILTTIAAEISYRLIEQPGIGWGKRLSDRILN